jgi:Flp pilus assembly protein TadG
MHSMLGRLFRDQRGISALEFAIIGTLMAGSIAAAVDLGDAAQQRIQLQQGVRAGGAYALQYPTDTTGITNAIKNALPSSWQAAATISTPTTSCGCWDGSTLTASASCSCSGSNSLEKFMTLSVSTPYSPIMSGITTNTASYVIRFQ